MFFCRVDIVLTNRLISSVCIITMIGFFLSSFDSVVGIDMFKKLWGLLNIRPERWCLQGYGILLGCTVSTSRWISCTDPLFLFVQTWSLKPRQNPPLLPWVYDQCCVCWALERSASYATYLLNASSGTNSSVTSSSPVAWIWFTRLRGRGDCCVTAVPAIASHGRWRHFCFRSHWILLLSNI